MAHRILVIEDDAALARGCVDYLQLHGFEALSAASIGEARAVLATGGVDLVVLDMRLPDGSGLDLLREIGSEAPVVVISALTEVADVLIAFGAGASDYLRKPFEAAELCVRITAVLRDRAEVTIDVAVERDGRRLIVAGVSEVFDNTEFGLLMALIAQPNVPVPIDQLVRNLHGRQQHERTAAGTIRMYIARIRKRLDRLGLRHRLLTVRGGRYVWLGRVVFLD